MMRYLLAGAAVLAMTIGALAQLGPAVPQIGPAVPTPVPSMPVFTPPASSSPPPSTTQRTVDGAGNQVDTTQTYRTGSFGTYSDQTTITTAPPGNPAAGTSITH